MNQSIVSDLCVMQKRVYVDCRSLSDLVSVAGITDRLVLFPRGIRQTFFFFQGVCEFFNVEFKLSGDTVCKHGSKWNRSTLHIVHHSLEPNMPTLKGKKPHRKKVGHGAHTRCHRVRYGLLTKEEIGHGHGGWQRKQGHHDVKKEK